MFTPSATTPYVWNAGHTYVEILPYVAPTTYTVTLLTGAGYSVTVQSGSSSPVTSGGSFSFTVAIAGGYHKGADFSVKANGTTLTANGRFMLVKGTLPQSLSYEVGIPNTGYNPGTLAFALIALAALCGIGAAVIRRKRYSKV